MIKDNNYGNNKDNDDSTIDKYERTVIALTMMIGRVTIKISVTIVIIVIMMII